MIKNEYINVRVNTNNINHFKSLGHTNIKYNDIINIHYSELQKTSNAIIIAICDYCGTEKEIPYKLYTKSLANVIHKFCCNKCRSEKTRESNLLKYGVINTSKLDSVKEKVKQTNIKLFSVESYTQTDEYKCRVKKSNLEKYNVQNVFQYQQIKDKQKQSCLNKYGCENVFQNNIIKEKIRNSLLLKYGEIHPMKVEHIKNNVIKKGLCTKYKNGTIICSKQQEYIWKLIGGELNYPVDLLSLDIAFPNEKIYIEYNGSGHDLDVKYKRISLDEFKHKEMKRYLFLKSLEWKQIEINSPQDYLLEDNLFINIINNSKIFLLTQSIHHITINIDEYKDTYKFKLPLKIS